MAYPPAARSSPPRQPSVKVILASADVQRVVDRIAHQILEKTQGAYGYLPVAALQHIAHQSGAWYSELYGIATSYPHLRFELPTTHTIAVCRCVACTLAGGGKVLAAFEEHLGTSVGGVSPDGAVRLETTDCRGESAGQGEHRRHLAGRHGHECEHDDGGCPVDQVRGSLPGSVQVRVPATGAGSPDLGEPTGAWRP